MADALKKFASQMEPELLDALQAIAEREGKKLQSVLGEAAREYVARKGGRVRPHVAAAFMESVEEHDELYRMLAE